MQLSRWHYITAVLVAFPVVAGISFGLGKQSANSLSRSKISEPLVVITLDEENGAETQALRKSLEASETRARLIAEENEDLRLKIEEFDATIRELRLNAQAIAREKSEFEAAFNEELSKARDENVALVAELEELSNEHKRPSEIAIKETGLNSPQEQEVTLNFETSPLQESAALSRGELAVSSPTSNGNLADLGAPQPSSNPQSGALRPGTLQQGLAAYKSQDYKKAYAAWIDLAEAGVRRAQFYIGGLYIDGHGVTKDRAMAHYWLTRSSKAGYAPSDPLLTEIIDLMTEAELDAAKKLLSGRQQDLIP